jgi:hypothetical protein
MSQAKADSTTKPDPTAAERARRYRARRRLALAPAWRDTLPVTQAVTPPVTAHATIGKQNSRATVAPIEARVTVMPPRRPAAPWTAAVLVIIALAITALALVINGQTGWRFGTTPLAAVTFAGLALAADLLAIVLPAAAVALWHVRRRGLAMAAWSTWIVAASLATLASLGFVELHTEDTAAAQGAAVATSTALADQRAAGITAARLAFTTATKQREAECAVRGARCREREADERTALGTLNAAIAAPVPPAPIIATADPQVTAALRLTTWAGLKLTADDVVNLRLVLMAMLPNIAGLVLMFGVALAFPAPRRAACHS